MYSTHPKDRSFTGEIGIASVDQKKRKNKKKLKFVLPFPEERKLCVYFKSTSPVIFDKLFYHIFESSLFAFFPYYHKTVFLLS